ncbi:50S ribosomal protein L3 [Candidatus Woesearchaeota archaeon]|jgi:large subunit ribosomal protein L3|nr:50S ribosomal protein L3 [Candidatus Woesearchaeota archaeon]MBT4387756.1 50S ribosomal protein L3 [Candidatus Woesearchaeota archaeon]MBT4595575.1 50S ribosomal protein L3 [Candidatus Woesearchaeota archaeon]MBT5740942.1 50S ribosomal protein L3 [Candidatus Woesearchaeota archaeon]MBT6506117.1 50S ribosomal protein L3 [Candidatus Woesearchaeota archaeon]
MPKTNAPRHGSMQFWPRKKAKKQSAPRLRNLQLNENIGLPIFAGYKAGMTHIQYLDNKKTSPLKGEIVNVPVTVIECPPIKIANVRFHKTDDYGTHCIGQFNNKVEKEMSKRFPLQKKESKKLEDFNDFDKVTITVYTQPKLTGIGKKAPDLMEVELNGKDNNEKIEWIKNNLSKEIKINEVFKEKIQVDIHGITRGRGYEGTTRRYNTPERQAKSEKHKRGVGSLGPWLPLVRHTVLFPSRWGSHLRTEHNKQLVKISNESDLVNPEGGFLKYGLVKNDYILVHGSVPGKANKLIVLSNAKRENKYMNMIDNVKYISKKSKQ